jgi:hypothetical protein
MEYRGKEFKMLKKLSVLTIAAQLFVVGALSESAGSDCWKDNGAQGILQGLGSKRWKDII